MRFREVHKKYAGERHSHYGEFHAFLYKGIETLKRVPIQYDIAERHFGKDEYCNYSVLKAFELDFEDENKKLFDTLSMQWKQETGLYTLPPKKINPTYLKIIARGKDFLPFILNDLQNGGSVYWHFALKAITEYTQIPDDFTNTKAIKAAWIRWGRDNSII